ncbi:MAG: hypothetical protein AABZ53_16425 [Planctomycetota bacterium]|mgnify:CR=1 FL=1
MIHNAGIVATSVGFACLVPAFEANAQFATFTGGASQELAWQAAAGGNVPLEDFESYHGGLCCAPTDQVTALPALGIVFATDVPGAYPGVYNYQPQAHSGQNQLANFGGGLSAYADYRILPESGKAIYALGFWQCDPQGDQTMYAFDALGTLVGQITGHINDGGGLSFAGFVSTIPIARVVVEGLLGDGWNHIDDLQVVARSSCPADFDGDGTPDFFDYDAFVICFEGGPCPPGPPPRTADFDADGTVDFFDYDAFVVAFEAGC